MEPFTEKEAGTETVQSVIPMVVADEIRRDAKAEMPAASVSRVISRILCTHYAKRIAAHAKANRRKAA